MERSIFKNCSELSEFMIDRAQDGYYVVAALYYNETKDLLRELLLYEDVDTELIEIEPVENNGYDKEYYVALTDNMIVTVERAYKYGRLLQTLTKRNVEKSILATNQKCHLQIIMNIISVTLIQIVGMIYLIRQGCIKMQVAML